MGYLNLFVIWLDPDCQTRIERVCGLFSHGAFFGKWYWIDKVWNELIEGGNPAHVF
jgi:hypothetical protein